MTQQAKTNSFKTGDKVLRRSDTTFVLVGTVEAVSASRCYVAWPEHNRINGNGILHTTVKHTALIAAKPEVIKRRQIKNLQIKIAHYQRYEGKPTCPVHKGWTREDHYCWQCGKVVEPNYHTEPRLAKVQAKLQELMQV